MDIKKQIQILIGLQEFDGRLMEINGRLKVLPARLEDMSKDLRKMEAVLAAENDELVDQDRFKAEKEEEHAFLSAQITRLRQQLQGVRAHRDAMALQRQLEASRKQLSDLEDEMLQTLQAVETRRAATAQHQAELEQLKKLLDTEEMEIRSEMETLQGEIAELNAKREVQAKDLDPEIRTTYQSLASRRHPSLVEAIDGRCTGCNISLRPQLYNTLFYANSLEVCPTCARLIFLRAAVFADEEPPAKE